MDFRVSRQLCISWKYLWLIEPRSTGIIISFESWVWNCGCVALNPRGRAPPRNWNGFFSLSSCLVWVCLHSAFYSCDQLTSCVMHTEKYPCCVIKMQAPILPGSGWQSRGITPGADAAHEALQPPARPHFVSEQMEALRHWGDGLTPCERKTIPLYKSFLVWARLTPCEQKLSHSVWATHRQLDNVAMEGFFLALLTSRQRDMFGWERLMSLRF